MADRFIGSNWVEHARVQLLPRYFQLDGIENQPIFLLDKDPYLCASYLVTAHLKQYIEYIENSVMYRNMKGKQKKQYAEKPRVDYMFGSQRTANFFYSLYEEMQEIYTRTYGTPYHTEGFNEEFMNDLTNIKDKEDVKHPRCAGIRLVHWEKLYNQNVELYSAYKDRIFPKRATSNPVNSFRLMYILNGYNYNEFPAGAPAWYTNLKTIIYENYNRFTRKHYKIEVDMNNAYTFYYSVDGEHWYVIETPQTLEFHSLIDGLLFTREV